MGRIVARLKTISGLLGTAYLETNKGLTFTVPIFVLIENPVSIIEDYYGRFCQCKHEMSHPRDPVLKEASR